MPDLARLRRRATRVLREAREVSRGASAADRADFSARRARTSEHHLLVAPPGGGNIGDQAMTEAFLERVEGPVVVVVRHEGDLDLPDGIGVAALPDLVYGAGTARREDLAEFEALVRGAASVSVIGADMLDGAYSVTGSVRRILLAELAALAGVPTRLLGFSWNERARPAALRALRHATAAGVVAVVRDPASAERLADVPGTVRGADLVFGSTGSEAGAVPGLTGPYAIVNASALVARTTGAAEYAPVVRHLLDAGLSVVLLPHVLRGTSDDAAACRAVAALVPDPRVRLVESRLAPAQVRGLAAGARLVVTGRMHLAILAATAGTPAVTFSTQGKVAGLMAMLDVDRLCVEPGPGLAARTVPLIDELLSSDDARERIVARLPAVRRLAAVNLPDADAPLAGAAA